MISFLFSAEFLDIGNVFFNEIDGYNWKDFPVKKSDR